MNILGSPSKTTILAIENDKLALEFEASADVKKGQPVTLDTNGKVKPWATADTRTKCLGVAHKNAATGELVTIVTRGFVLINAYAAGALNAVPVTYASYDSTTDVGGTTGYSVYAASATDADLIGWNLTKVTGAGLIQVLLLG